MDLHLRSDNDDESHPRRLVRMGCHLVAYGGDNGTLSAIALAVHPSSETNHHKNNNNKNKKDVCVPIRRYDDDMVRAVAISDDGKRVVVGFEEGTTKVYVYDDYDSKGNDDATSVHPFVGTTAVVESMEADETNPSCSLSQDPWSSSSQTSELAVRPGETVWNGPSIEGPLRVIQFCPGTHTIIVATEAGGCVSVSVATAEEASQVVTLDDDGNDDHSLYALSKRHHNASGIRSLALYQVQHTIWMATLAMDGRVCLWKCTLSSSSSLSSASLSSWTLVQRDAVPCVTKKDVGEHLGADAWDRSCRPHFLGSLLSPHATTNWILSLPGEPYLQFRRGTTVGSTGSVRDCDSSPPAPSITTTTITTATAATTTVTRDGPIQGHIEAIVCSTSLPGEPFLVTAGRDGRVIVWQVTEQTVRTRTMGEQPTVTERRGENS